MSTANGLSVRVFLLRLEVGAQRFAGNLRQLVEGLYGHAPVVPPAACNEPPALINATVDPFTYWDEAMDVLSPDEARRAERLRFQPRRQAYVYAHASLRLLLARLLGETPAAAIALTQGPKGKPRLAHDRRDVHFSISYRDGYAALALGSVPLGIDIESVNERIDMEEIAARYFMPSEREYLAAAASSDKASVFFNVWTRKEALVKAAGVGINKLAVANALESVAVLTDDCGNLQRYCVQDLEVSADHAMALATIIGPKGDWQ